MSDQTTTTRTKRSAKKEWRVQVLAKGKARKVDAIFVTNGSERAGYYPSRDAAQAECDRRNQALENA